jgi:predicted transcriptional regulator
MHEKRCNALIFTQILKTCTAGTSTVRIIFASRMIFNNVKPYLASLTESGFIETVNGTSYRTTEKGLEALEHPTVIQDLSWNMETGMDNPQLQD